MGGVSILAPFNLPPFSRTSLQRRADHRYVKVPPRTPARPPHSSQRIPLNTASKSLVADRSVECILVREPVPNTSDWIATFPDSSKRSSCFLRDKSHTFTRGGLGASSTISTFRRINSVTKGSNAAFPRIWDKSDGHAFCLNRVSTTNLAIKNTSVGTGE